MLTPKKFRKESTAFREVARRIAEDIRHPDHPDRVAGSHGMCVVVADLCRRTGLITVALRDRMWARISEHIDLSESLSIYAFPLNEPDSLDLRVLAALFLAQEASDEERGA